MTTRRGWWLSLVLILASCTQKQPAADLTGTGINKNFVAIGSGMEGPCPDELGAITLRRINFSHRNSADAAGLDAEDKELSCLRDWAAKLPDRCTREAYVTWIGHFERQVDKARTDLKNKVPNESDFDREQRLREARIQQYAAAHPEIPTPPRRLCK